MQVIDGPLSSSHNKNTNIASMAKLDFSSFEIHLSAFDFARLFVDVLGWNRAPAEGQW